LFVLQIAAANAAPTWAAFAAGWASNIALIILYIFGAARIAKCNEAFAIRAELRIIGTSFAWLQVGTRPESSREPIRVRRVRERPQLRGTAIRTT
jgi:hypothetical protein